MNTATDLTSLTSLIAANDAARRAVNAAERRLGNATTDGGHDAALTVLANLRVSVALNSRAIHALRLTA